jgi:hypothetical protein
VCLGVVKKPRDLGGPAPLGGCGVKNKTINQEMHINKMFHVTFFTEMFRGRFYDHHQGVIREY